MYPGVEVVEWTFWEDEQIHEAVFEYDDYPVAAVFLPSGQWVQSRTEVFEWDLPEKIMEYFSEIYPEAGIFPNFIKIDSPESTEYEVSFELEVEGEVVVKTLLFDVNGDLSS